MNKKAIQNKQKCQANNKSVDVSAYLILGPENVSENTTATKLVSVAIRSGFSCVQIRSKQSSAKELVKFCEEVARAIAAENKTGEVALLVNDRLDVALEARDLGVHIDGMHVGQSDISPATCRKYLREGSVVGLSAKTKDAFDWLVSADVSGVDYLGIGPYHETISKLDVEKDESGVTILSPDAEIAKVCDYARVTYDLPVVVGGGVVAGDLEQIKAIGADGFFVISAVCGAEDPEAVCAELVSAWKNAR